MSLDRANSFDDLTRVIKRYSKDRAQKQTPFREATQKKLKTVVAMQAIGEVEKWMNIKL
jgi:hypothetical protein